MASRIPLACVAIAVLSLQLTAYVADAIEPHLEILPSGETQTKPIGSSIILTCKPKVENLQLVDDMQWLDPMNRVIESLNMHTRGQSKPAMYTELHQDRSLSLFFNSLREEQAGKYTCKGTYARNQPLNNSVTIDTIIAITWENAPTNQFPILGDDFSVMCKVRAKPSPAVDWLYNGELIKTSDRYIISAHSLKIKKVQESDDGIYTCRASVQTTGELQERPIRVEVHVRPSIDEITSPIDIIEGDNANIKCKAHGKPEPTITWVKSLTQQNLSITDRFGVDPVKGVLTITNVHRDDAGEYQCRATNAADTASTTIQVNVIVKPKVMEFWNKTVVQDKKTEIMCKAFGRPPPVVTFRKFTNERSYEMGVQADARISLKNQPTDVPDETMGILSIEKAVTSDDGLYECIAKNSGGVAYKNGHLTVEFPPSFRSMQNKTYWSWDQRAVNLTCIAESIPNATIRWTFYGDRKVEDDGGIQVIGNGPTSVLRVWPSYPRYYTNYKCIASNTHGTREHLIELKEATKPGFLFSAKMAELTATSIRFELVPPVTHPDLPIQTISVQYKEVNEIWNNLLAKNRTWSVGSLYVVEGLKPQTTYNFRFAVKNEVGMGSWGADLTETTPGRTVPNQPKILNPSGKEYEKSKYSNQYEITWLAPPDNGEPIDTYLIKYCEITRVAGDWELLENTCVEITTQTRTSLYLKGLKSNTFYRVELQAHNIMGFSKPGFLKFKTAPESSGTTVDDTVISAAGDTRKIAVAAITAAVILLSLAI